ncbi:hypothetical protein LSAT2_020110 [Lamellibrachia satsuma]|nr:hypothetical protein LSAT2_020110 [Lamellibrachia satsuma]
MYLVVEFTDHHETAVIPSTWLDGTNCAVWPPFKNTTKITNAAKEKASPGTDWKAYPIKELYKNESYAKVRRWLVESEKRVTLGLILQMVMFQIPSVHDAKVPALIRIVTMVRVTGEAQCLHLQQHHHHCMQLPAGGCRCWPDRKTDISPQADANVGPMDKPYIGTQADANIGPMEKTTSARRRMPMLARWKKLPRPAGGCRCWPDKFAVLGPMLSLRTKLTSARMQVKQWRPVLFTVFTQGNGGDQMLVLLGKLSCGINLLEKTCRSHRSQDSLKIRKRHRTTYMIEGRHICVNTFKFLHPRCKGLQPKEKRNPGRDNNARAYSFEDIKRTVAFKNNSLIYRSANLSESDKSERLIQQEQQLMIVQQERSLYNEMECMQQLCPAGGHRGWHQLCASWGSSLSPFYKPLHGIKGYQHFRFDGAQPGKVFLRETLESPETTFVMSTNSALPTTAPAAVPAPGLNAQSSGGPTPAKRAR